MEQAITDILLKIKIKNFLIFHKFQSTFHYDSQFWSNRIAYNLPGSKTGFDSQETNYRPTGTHPSPRSVSV